MTPAQLILAAKRTADTVDTLGVTFARALRHVLKDTERRLRPIIRDAADGNRTAIVRAAQANRTRVDIRTALQSAGYDALAETATGAPLDRMVAKVLAGRRFAQASADLTAGMEIRLGALKALQGQDLIDEGTQVARALWQATLRGIFGSRSVDRILDDLGAVLDDSEPRIQTLYDTSVSIFGRQVEALQAGEDSEATFAYMGPVDEKTRDFCLGLVGKVLTRAEIDALDNGQLDNCFLTGGGYNCRHIWMEVSKFSELQNLGNQRIPEVQDQLDALAEAA